MRVLSSVIIIAESDKRNIEYLINWFEKISVGQLFFQYGTYSEKLPLPFLTFLKSEGLYFI